MTHTWKEFRNDLPVSVCAACGCLRDLAYEGGIFIYWRCDSGSHDHPEGREEKFPFVWCNREPSCITAEGA